MTDVETPRAGDIIPFDTSAEELKRLYLLGVCFAGPLDGGHVVSFSDDPERDARIRREMVHESSSPLEADVALKGFVKLQR